MELARAPSSTQTMKLMSKYRKAQSSVGGWPALRKSGGSSEDSQLWFRDMKRGCLASADQVGAVAGTARRARAREIGRGLRHDGGRGQADGAELQLRLLGDAADGADRQVVGRAFPRRTGRPSGTARRPCPAATPSLSRAGSWIVPRRLDSCPARPRPARARPASSGWISTNGAGSRRTSFSDLAVRVSVCQWAYSRPVVSTKRELVVGQLARGCVWSRGRKRARPSGVGKRRSR